MLRKYFDAAPADVGGAAPAEAIVETPSAAAVMAKSGVKISAGEPSPEPKKEPAAAPPPKTEPTPPAPTSAETATPAPPAKEPPKSEVKPTAPAPVKAEEPAKPAPVADWKQVLKSQKPDAVLTELGFDAKQVKLLETIKADPKMAKFYEVWAAKGDVTAYLKAASIDYTKMPPQDVMRHSLREKYSDMSTEDFDELYKMKVFERYKLDGNEEYTVDEIKRGRIELAADSKDHRDLLIKQQQDYLLSVAPDLPPVIDDGAAKAAEAEQQRTALREAYKQHMQADPDIKGILATKTIKIGEGEEAFNYGVTDPEALLGLLNDADKWTAKLFTKAENGDLIPNGYKQALIAAIADDDQGFMTAFAAHYKAIGAKNVIAPIENASMPGGQPSKGDTSSTNPAEAMAKSGKIIRGGE